MCIVQLYKTIALIVVSEFASSTIGKIISICQGTNLTLKIENELLDSSVTICLNSRNRSCRAVKGLPDLVLQALGLSPGDRELDKFAPRS